jgi:predicted Zn-dependent protease
MFRYYQLLGFPDEALKAAQGAARLDPLSVVDRLNVASALVHIARFGEAAEAAQAALRLEPNQSYVKAMLCTSFAHSGRLAEARALAAGFSNAHDTSSGAGCAFDIAVSERRMADAHKIMDGLAAGYPNIDLGPADLGDAYAIIGDSRSAVVWLGRAYDERDFTLFTIPFDRAIPPSVFADPEWKALVQRPLFKDWRAAHDRLAADLSELR